MKLYNEIKSLRDESRKSGDKIKLEILKLVVGEADTIIGREGTIKDNRLLKIIAKLVQSNYEVYELAPDQHDLMEENKILEKFLPTLLSNDEVRRIVNVENIRKADSVGKAIKGAISDLSWKAIDREMVAKIVRELREG